MKTETRVWTLDELILAEKVKLGRGNIISKKDIASFPGEFPIYSSAREKNGTFGYYGKYMFDEELITWSIDGGGRLFYRPRHKFSVTNVGGTLRIIDTDFLDCRYLHLVLTHLHSKIRFDWVYKAHPSVIRTVYNEIPIPSLEKQCEIVKKLDSAFAEIDLLERNLELSDERANHLLQSLLSASFANAAFRSESSHSAEDRELAKKNEVLNDFTKVFTVIPDSKTKIKSSFYLESGKYAVVDQGKDLVAGYTNTAPTVNENSLPVIVFGDHTRAVKYVDFPFTAGADGTQILKPSPMTNPKYSFYLVLHAVSQIPSKGYARHFGELRKMSFPLPSPERQNEIVEKLDSAFVEIELLKSQFRMKKDYAVALRRSLLSSAFSQEEDVA